MNAGFMPHGLCFLWQPGVLTLHVVSDALVALAYFSIPALLVWFVRRRPDVPFLPVFWMFSLFIVSCGCTHLMSIWVIWHPAYWFEGAVKATTALASVATAAMLVPLLPRAIALRSPVELDRLNAILHETLVERESLLRRYERQHHIARTLQDASLATLPQRIGRFGLSAVYRPGTGDLEIGGDWYDAFRMSDGRVVVSVGDVTGKGLVASVIMSKVRQALRVAAQIQIPPGAVLDAADRALREEYPHVIVTAFIAIIDDVEGVITYANAGHPRPLMRLPDGSVRELGGGGLPLGLRQREETNDTQLTELIPGSVLVFFTDGLIEAARDYELGEARLRAILADRTFATADDPAALIAGSVLDGEIRDDVAIMTVCVGDDPDDGIRRRFDPRDRTAADATRAAIRDALSAGGVTKQDVVNAELVYSELIGNALRYAEAEVDVRFAWETGSPVLHVLDRGPGFRYVPHLPSDIMSENGRGLFLVTALVDEFSILRRPGGGSHARAVLRASRLPSRR